jgi:hypothetical protein
VSGAPNDLKANPAGGGTPVTPAGWIIVNISGTDYYIPAWQ